MGADDRLCRSRHHERERRLVGARIPGPGADGHRARLRAAGARHRACGVDMTMRGYLIRRVPRAALALVLVVLITYLLFGVLPHTGAGSLSNYVKDVFVNSYRGRGAVPGLIVARRPAPPPL